MSLQDAPSGPYESGQEPPAVPDEEDTEELGDFLARAVDRQIAEQRALRDAFDDLREAVVALQAPQTEPALALDLEDLTERVRRAVKDDAQEELLALRDSVSSASADIEGIAQALIELNAGLRGWADGVDRNIGSLIKTVNATHEVALHAQAEDPEFAVEPSKRAGGNDIDQRIKESVELQLYLADQIEDFDRALGRIVELPTKLEGVIAQALKRTLAARAKLDRDAEASLSAALGAIDEHVERMLERLEVSDTATRAKPPRRTSPRKTSPRKGSAAARKRRPTSSSGTPRTPGDVTDGD